QCPSSSEVVQNLLHFLPKIFGIATVILKRQQWTTTEGSDHELTCLENACSYTLPRKATFDYEKHVAMWSEDFNRSEKCDWVVEVTFRAQEKFAKWFQLLSSRDRRTMTTAHTTDNLSKKCAVCIQMGKVVLVYSSMAASHID
ncbi:hypothetical protein ACTXT7_016223, partial [Hymenolepis weldensis]